MADAAWSITGSLIAGIALYAGIGWVLSLWFGHRELLVAGGALLGMALAFYLIVKRLPEDPPASPAPRQDRR